MKLKRTAIMAKMYVFVRDLIDIVEKNTGEMLVGLFPEPKELGNSSFKIDYCFDRIKETIENNFCKKKEAEKRSEKSFQDISYVYEKVGESEDHLENISNKIEGAREILSEIAKEDPALEKKIEKAILILLNVGVGCDEIGIELSRIKGYLR